MTNHLKTAISNLIIYTITCTTIKCVIHVEGIDFYYSDSFSEKVKKLFLLQNKLILLQSTNLVKITQYLEIIYLLSEISIPVWFTNIIDS